MWDWQRFADLAASAGFTATDCGDNWWRMYRGENVQVAHVLIDDYLCGFFVNNKRPAKWPGSHPSERPFKQDEFDAMFKQEFAAEIAAESKRLADKWQDQPDDDTPTTPPCLSAERARRLASLYTQFAKADDAARKALDRLNCELFGV